MAITDHGFQKLDMSSFTHHIEKLKALAAQRRGQEEYEAKSEYHYQDSSHLTARNLEEHDYIDHDAYGLQCKPIPLCGECQGGWIITRSSQSSAPTSTMCKRCEVPRRWTHRLNKLELPSNAIGMHLDSYEPDSQEQINAINNMIEYLNRESSKAPAILTYGPSGNGKTSILYALARESCQLGWKVRYLSHTQIINDIQESFKGKDIKNPTKRWLEDVDVLLLDEFCGIGGSAMKQGWWVKQTIELVEQIYRKWRAGKLSVMITTNVYPKEMFQIFNNNAFKSRMLGMCTPVEMKGRDRRIQNVDLSAWNL